MKHNLIGWSLNEIYDRIEDIYDLDIRSYEYQKEVDKALEELNEELKIRRVWVA
jgi:hypothetical protein